MERRLERRLAANEPAVVTELDLRHPRPKGGLIVELSGSSLTMKLPEAIAPGTPVKVETWNMLMLGEVVRCEPAGDGFRLALMLRHSLRDLAGLEKRNTALLADRREDRRTAPENPPPVPIMRE
jgi:hypothetical protein